MRLPKSCTGKSTPGSDRAANSIRTPTKRKKRRIRAQLRALGPNWVKLCEDETDLLLFPPLRAAWGRRGQPRDVRISGHNARRVVFGAIDLDRGERLFLARRRQRSADFCAFQQQVADHYEGRPVAMLVDEDPSHTAQASQALAEQLRIRLIWLPKRCPKLNAMDHLWGHGKDHVCANRQYDDIDAETERFIAYLQDLSDEEALRQAGVLSSDFWLKV
jgi:transposase